MVRSVDENFFYQGLKNKEVVSSHLSKHQIMKRLPKFQQDWEKAAEESTKSSLNRPWS